MRDIAAEVNDDTHEITWGYSKENETQVCDELVAKVGELFTDEETGEQVVIERYDSLDTMWWDGTEEDAKALYDKICASIRRAVLNPSVHDWVSNTPFNRMVIVEQTMKVLEKMPHDLLNENTTYGWACEELGYAYYYGEEQWGYHRDLDKAREYYALAEQVKELTGCEELLRAGNPFKK